MVEVTLRDTFSGEHNCKTVNCCVLESVRKSFDSHSDSSVRKAFDSHSDS